MDKILPSGQGDTMSNLSFPRQCLAGLGSICASLAVLSSLAAQAPAPRLVLEHEDYVGRIAFHKDGKILASCSGKSVRLWDVATGKSIATLNGHTASVFALAFSPDGKTLASGSGKEIKLWDVERQKATVTVPGTSPFPDYVIAFSPDGKMVTGRNPEAKFPQIKFWDVATGKELTEVGKRLKGNGYLAECVAFCPDGKSLAAGTVDGIMLWDLKTGNCMNLTPKTGASKGGNVLAFSPDGKTLATQRGGPLGTLRLFDVATQQVIATSGDQRSGGVFRAVAFSPDGKLLATANEFTFGETGGIIQLWDATRLRKAATLKFYANKPDEAASVQCVAFSPDGKTLAASSGKAVKVWEVPAILKK